MDTTNMQTDNHMTKALHAGLYDQHLPGQMTTSQPSEPTVATLKSPIYNFTFSHLDYLIDTIRDIQIIDKQIKNYHATMKTNNKVQENANIILHKDKTQSQLAEYLHATCYALVKSTFIKAIKTIISSHGRD